MLEPRICRNPECGDKFHPTRRNNFYCSQKCKLDANNSKRRKEDYGLEHDLKTMRKNVRILDELSRNQPRHQGVISRPALAKLGFDLKGPFYMQEPGDPTVVYIGKYRLHFGESEVRYLGNAVRLPSQF